MFKAARESRRGSRGQMRTARTALKAVYMNAESTIDDANAASAAVLSLRAKKMTARMGMRNDILMNVLGPAQRGPALKCLRKLKRHRRGRGDRRRRRDRRDRRDQRQQRTQK